MTPSEVLAFCFPYGIDRDLERHMAFWKWFMGGGATSDIVRHFRKTHEAAASGRFADWPRTPDGRLALIIVLDQFSRSIYDGSPNAYRHDAEALRLCQEGLANGHYAALRSPWEKTVFALPLVHAEGPDLAKRAAINLDLANALIGEAPGHLRAAYEFTAGQSRRHKAVIDRFGRHPHRNPILGRPSTEEEEAYLAEGDFPHKTEIRF